MPRYNNLSRMSIDSLVELRESISAILIRRVADIRRQLSSIDGAIMPSGSNGNPRSLLKGRKIPAKYRSKADPRLTWAGRGVTPLWMREEMKVRKLNKEAFLID